MALSSQFKRILFFLILGVILVSSAPTGFALGVYFVYLDIYGGRSAEQARTLKEMIADHPKYAELKVVRYTNGCAYVSGDVASRKILGELRRDLRQLLGSTYADTCIKRVECPEAN